MTPHKIYLNLSSADLIRVVCPGTDEGNCKVWVMTDTCHCDCKWCVCGYHSECANTGLWPSGPFIGEPGCKLEEAGECGIVHYLGDIDFCEMVFDSTGEWTYAPDGAALVVVGWSDGVPALTPWTEE